MTGPGPHDYDPEEDFGMNGTDVSTRDEGGFHHTVYDDGAHFSWETDAKGDYVEGSAHETIHGEEKDD